MKKENRAIRLYNVMFPVYFFYLYPTAWLYILPANFVIDSAVLAIAMKAFGLEKRLAIWKKTILPIWVIGFAADIAGAVLNLGLYMVLAELPMNWYGPPLEQLIVLPGIALAGVLIYVLNRWLTFRKTELEKEQIHRLTLSLAVFTAPYTMLIPTLWLYRGAL